MESLNLPTYSFSIKSEQGRSFIFDPIRKKYVSLSPEEWVRQHFVQYLIQELDYPSSLIAVEKEFSFNRMKKRTDILVHNRQGEAILLVECKAPEVVINRTVFDQIGLYNLSYRVPFLLVTNGLKHYCCRYNEGEGKYLFLDYIPGWEELLQL